MQSQAVVLAVRDTKNLNNSHHSQTEGLADIGTKQQNQTTKPWVRNALYVGSHPSRTTVRIVDATIH